MVNTAQQLQDLPSVADAWADGAISGLHVHQILAHAPRIDDFTAKQAAAVGLAKLTDASEVRRVLQVVADADNPAHLDLTIDQQRAKRSLRLSARANGMWAITGLLDEVDGAILADTLASFTRPPDTHDTTTPAQRRADALADMANSRRSQPPARSECPQSASWSTSNTCPTVTRRPWSTAPRWAPTASTCCPVPRCAR